MFLTKAHFDEPKKWHKIYHSLKIKNKNNKNAFRNDSLTYAHKILHRKRKKEK